MNLIIVESPTKARTLSRFLGKDFQIEATMGHIRDLPKDKLGVDINHDFEPHYIVSKEKKKIVEKLKKLVRELETKETGVLRSTKKYNDRYKNLYLSKIILATDLDREGEAIAWHTVQILNLDEVKSPRTRTSSMRGRRQSKVKNYKRIVFHEITRQAVEEALKHPRGIDINLVNAQQGRRVLDRLVGYKLSPLLWYKTGKNWLSAGRVQSVAVRLIVERERERQKFKPEEFWRLMATFTPENRQEKIEAELAAKEGKAYEISQTHRLFDGTYTVKKTSINTEQEARKIIDDFQAPFTVQSVHEREVRKTPSPPFITSTLQRAGANLFGWPARKTMIIAQNLYEQGAITYHRTDSVHLSEKFLLAVALLIKEKYGEKYVASQPRRFKARVKAAQEAHEAIRPTDVWRKVQNGFSKEMERLYDLIWKRAIASQAAAAIFDSTKIKIVSKNNYLFEVAGSVIKFEGYLKITGRAFEDKILPKVKVGEQLKLVKTDPLQKFTQPPARYNEASLIKALEDKGIGRPSTYAPIISTIQARQYVEKEERAFKPTELGLAVNDFLVANFGETINVEFTAKMEDKLDEIAKGKLKWVGVIREFWEPFEEQIAKIKEQKGKIKIKVEEVAEKCPKDGGQLVVRIGKYGKFLACKNFPKCRFTKPMVEKTGIKCPKCRGEVVLKKSKKGRRFYGCSNYPECNFASWTKPK